MLIDIKVRCCWLFRILNLLITKFNFESNRPDICYFLTLYYIRFSPLRCRRWYKIFVPVVSNSSIQRMYMGIIRLKLFVWKIHENSFSSTLYCSDLIIYFGFLPVCFSVNPLPKLFSSTVLRWILFLKNPGIVSRWEILFRNNINRTWARST